MQEFEIIFYEKEDGTEPAKDFLLSKEREIKMTDFNAFVAEQMKNEDFRKEYESLEPEFSIKQAMIDARTQEGLTQKELSLRSGIAQSDISKLENGTANPSVKTLQRLAAALGKRLKIEFV